VVIVAVAQKDFSNGPQVSIQGKRICHNALPTARIEEIIPILRLNKS